MGRTALLPFRLAGTLAAVAAWVLVVPFVELARVGWLRAGGRRPECVLDLRPE
jgi:hypothetical protein